MVDILIDFSYEFLKAIGRLLINPLFYWFFILTYLVSARRVAKERRYFGHKIFSIFDEWYGEKIMGLFYGMLVSLLLMVVGVVIPPLMLTSLIVVTFILSFPRRIKYLSSVYVFGTAAFVLLFLPLYESYLPDLLSAPIEVIDWVSFTTLMGIFLIIETVMLRRVKEDQTFPETFIGARGKTLGQHRIKRMTLMPLLLLWPTGDLTMITDWWPLVDSNPGEFGLILFPVILGFNYVVKSQLPLKFAKRYSNQLMILALIIISVSLVGYFIPIFSLISIVIAILGRALLDYRVKVKDQQQPIYFQPTPLGLRVLAVVPQSPATDMGILAGDVIRKVNGVSVHSTNDFYHALQRNLAFCKLDVLDEYGEVRFCQRAYYQGEHHKLGMVFVEAE
ncbi:PDZ domain-containing protein [Streptohalobacillus salinus]|uniref:PDZ domain-containing protein n=1 Tax=Streptohalobacillus salinus TaxID=621096 RepID=A0A2V3WDG7_9BACI|nr:PDZ domain-containing protein [Streptohalobacillus salinus]PXW91486.1 PDZ domain-containing protein [Streptohalobacillus salinus]